MGRARPRYNEKARASSLKEGQRPHPKARNGGLNLPRPGQEVIVESTEESTEPKKTTPNTVEDTNAYMIIPGESSSKKSEAASPARTKYVSAKKRKLMEKYIESRLKKDARAGLMEKLSTSSWSSDLLKSSKHIGRSGQTLREELRQALLEQKAGLEVSNKDVKLFVEKETEEIKETLSPPPVQPKSAPAPVPVVGGALKKDGSAPVQTLQMRKRKKKSLIPEASRRKYKKRQGIESDSSFDSSDSANDSESDSDEESFAKRKRSQAQEEPEEDEQRPTALEEAVEAAKQVKTPLAPRPEEEDELKTQLLKSHREGDLSHDAVKPFYVPVKRKPEIEEARSKLPVCAEEQVIMEAIRNNTVVIICGETGSGKTTQVPQFLYEAGWSHPESDNPGLIGITQPRRVATVSTATRVAEELNLSQDEISYQIRYDATVSQKTRMKFMTDGVLLRELSEDLLLTKYSVIIIDEAHERNLNTDILIGVMSRVLRLRAELSFEDREKIKPLRVVIMSATLRVADFTENKTLFAKPPPVINVNARQFPVSIHFSRRTPQDYVGEAYKKICKIHRKLPSGGILVFLTGQNEINHLCKILRKKFPPLSAKATQRQRKHEKKAESNEQESTELPAGQADVENEDVDLGENDVIEDFDLDTDEEDDSDVDIGFDDDDDMEEFKDAPLHVLPLYSLLPTEAQLRVFEAPPEGTRLCVVATNVAETSVTIPGIRYVVDCGKSKERHYNVQTGVQSFEIGWTSKASAGQRAGRAGRTQAGHCYRLYSSAVFDNEFEKFSLPEIQRMPLEGVVLNMKSMCIDQVVNFPFPTPPPRENLAKAEKLLQYLGALNSTTKRITEFGEAMALFPIAPRLSKMLIIGQQHNCMPYVIIMASILSTGDPFQMDGNQNSSKNILKFATEGSDILSLVTAVGAFEYAGGSFEFCDKYGLRFKAMNEIRQLRRQLTNIVASHFPDIDICVDPKLAPPSKKQIAVLKQIFAAGYIDSIAIRADVLEAGGAGGVRHKNARDVAYKLMWSDEDAFIHPTSVLYAQEPPQMVAYGELSRSQSGQAYLKMVTAVDSKWLSNIGKELCTFGRPQSFPRASLKGKAYVIPSFGPKQWPLPPVAVDL